MIDRLDPDVLDRLLSEVDERLDGFEHREQMRRRKAAQMLGGDPDDDEQPTDWAAVLIPMEDW